jgi:hypothetical protein
MRPTVALLAAACGSAPATHPGAVPPPPTSPSTTDTAVTERDSATQGPAGEWRFLTVSGWFGWDATSGEVVDARVKGETLPSTLRLGLHTSTWEAHGYDPAMTTEYCHIDLVFRAGPPLSTEAPPWDSDAFLVLPHSDEPADVVTTCGPEAGNDLGLSLFGSDQEGSDPFGPLLDDDEPWSMGIGAARPDLTFAARGLRGRVYDPTYVTWGEVDDYTVRAYEMDAATLDVGIAVIAPDDIWDGTTAATGFYAIEAFTGVGYNFVPF